MTFNSFLNLVRQNNWLFLVAVFILLLVGLAAVYSVALGQGEFLNFQKQVIWITAGLLTMFFISRINYSLWRKFSWLGYFLSIILLILVLTPLGSDIRGSQGWFNLGFFSFQPVELVKIFLVMVLADLYSRYSRAMYKFGHLLVTGFAAFLPFILVLLQPDFGSAMVLFFMWFGSFILASRNKWHVIFIVVSVVILFVFAWLFIFQDYQKDRILTFLDPSLDPLGRGYNVRQSIIAVGAGGMFGRGLGFGSQSQLKFIPESQTDFIFAVIAEELGLVGVFLLLGLFMFLFYRLYDIASRSPDDFAMFVVILVALLLFSHIFINIGMGLGMMPVTGISLPLVSYGGSFLLTILILLGIVLNIDNTANISRNT